MSVIPVGFTFAQTSNVDSDTEFTTDSYGEITGESTVRSSKESLSKKGPEKVGLVLSGGGAKGIAHVGVIKALEDNDIPIDYVTGTSMGAIVGSLYSMGWTPEQMMDLFTSKEFGYWSMGKIDPNETYYYYKSDPTPEWLSVNISPKDTVTSIANQIMPTNLISPLPMNIEFLEIFAPYTKQCNENFNNLFVPFRCVTSDVFHKHKIVLSSGSLGDAVRASMSFPLVYKPIKIDGTLVYDGGIYDNFPVDVMQQDFNPDFIIGVSVSSPDSKPQANNIYSQLEDMIIQNNNYNVPADKGIKIQVPVLQFGVLDFNQAKTIYDIGYKTGMAMVDSIKSRVKSRRELSEVMSRREAFSKATPDVLFDNIEITGATPSQTAYLKYMFDPERKKKFGLKEVQTAYYRALAEGKFNDLLPQAEFGAKNNNTLLLQANVKQPWHFGVGGWITSSTNSQLYVNVGYHTLSLNSLDLDLKGWIGQSYYAGMASAKFALRTGVPSCLQADFVVSGQKYYDNEVMFFQTKSPQFVTHTETFFRLTYCRELGRLGKIFAGIGYGWLHDSYFPQGTVDFVTRDKDHTNYRTLAVRGGMERNCLNDLLYPSKGSELKINAILTYEQNKNQLILDGANSATYTNHLGASVEALWRHYYELHDRFSLGVTATGVAGIMKLYDNYTATLVHSPAFAPTPSTQNYFNVAFRSPSYLAAGLSPVWNIVGNLQLRGDFYTYAPVRNISQGEGGDAYYSGWFKKVDFIGEVAAVYNFPFASVSLYCNYLSYPARNWNFGINFGLLFQAPKLIR